MTAIATDPFEILSGEAALIEREHVSLYLLLPTHGTRDLRPTEAVHIYISVSGDTGLTLDEATAIHAELGEVLSSARKALDLE